MSNAEKLLEEISAVKQEILAAVDELDRVVHDIEIKPRADKMVITKVVQKAFARVETAKTHLTNLKRLARNI